jgi:hypothetical protein
MLEITVSKTVGTTKMKVFHHYADKDEGEIPETRFNGLPLEWLVH